METNWLCRIGHRMGLRARAAVLAMFFALTATSLTGCGGGGSGTSPTDPVAATVAGFFDNLSPPTFMPCCNPKYSDGSMAVTSDGTTYLVLDNGVLFAGHLSFTTTALTSGFKQVTGSGVVYSPTSIGGLPVASSWMPVSGATLSGTMGGNAFISTLSIPGMGDYSVGANYNPASTTPVTLASLTGNYASAHTQLTIDGNGVITGSDGTCPRYDGNATLPNASYDVFSITLTCTPASGSPYTMTGLTARGTATPTPGNTDLLVLMLADPASGKNVYMRLARQ